jgi:N6-L-threonylcarbamoyladenine synthase
MLVLGVESSCDETAAAVVRGDGLVLSDVVRSQVDAHAPYGGIVPEIAARDHLRAVAPVVGRALEEAGVTLADVDAVAATCQPGLVGALLVGMQLGKGLAWGASKPFVGVDHLMGHLLSVFLRRSEEQPAAGPTFPFLGLLVSGGHTALYRAEAPRPEAIEELGATRDDAVGEAFDKVAKLLGLGYPGGPIIDRLAAEGDAAAAPVRLPVPMGHRDSPEFSFSGIKSAVARHVATAGVPVSRQDKANLCAAFQRVVTRTLVKKTVRTALRLGIREVVVTGGVAANRELRERMARACDEHGLALYVPPLRSCTDNAAMIAYAGAVALAGGQRDTLDRAPSTRTLLPRVTRKGRGKRSVSL